MNPPVIVVGAGIIGCAVARELSSRGIASFVIDEHAPGSGATHASAGMLAPYVEGHEGGLLRDLGVRSLDLYDDWIAAVRHDMVDDRRQHDPACRLAGGAQRMPRQECPPGPSPSRAVAAG